MTNKPLRPIKIEGGVAYIELTRGYVATIDPSDVKLVEGYNWTAMVEKNTAYAYRAERRGGKRFIVRMHRMLTEAPSGMDVDHIDGDGLNNRRCNLRVCTESENSRNQRIRSDNTSGYKGVSWLKSRKKWISQIRADGKTIRLGSFGSAEDAYKSYCEASNGFMVSMGG